MRTRSLWVSRRFDASCERVFEAWLDPATPGTWMLGSNVSEEDVVHLKADARVDGVFSFLVCRDCEECCTSCQIAFHKRKGAEILRRPELSAPLLVYERRFKYTVAFDRTLCANAKQQPVPWRTS